MLGALKAKDGAGIPHPTLSQLGRTALAAPDSSGIDEGSNARVGDPAQGKHCPSPGVSLPWKLQGEGSDCAQFRDLGPDIWRRKSHLGKKLEMHLVPVLLFFLFSSSVFQNESPSFQLQKRKIYMQLFCSTKYQKHSLFYPLETPQPFSHLSSVFCHSQVYLACFRHKPFPNK